MDDVTKEEIIKEAIRNAKSENEKAKKKAKAARQQDKDSDTPAEEASSKKMAEDVEKEGAAGAEESGNNGDAGSAPESTSEENDDPGSEDAKEKASEDESSQDGEDNSGSRGGFFKKKDKKDKSKERIEELEDKVKRQLAEFENFRNRTEKEKAQMYDMGAKSVLEKILPVIDNFERGLAAVPEGEGSGAFAEGMNMIYKQLMTELEKMGVTPIEAVGTEFDPNLHNAVMQTQSDEYESGFVAVEMQKGYKYHDTVIRHSMVGVVP